MRRFGAFLIDLVLFGVLPGIIVGAAGIPALTFVISLLALTFVPAALLARTGAHHGQTPGKQLLGLRVHAQNAPTLTFGRALGREALKAVSIAIVPIALISAIPALFESMRLAGHDDIADTIVTRADADQAFASALAHTPDGAFTPAPAGPA